MTVSSWMDPGNPGTVTSAMKSKDSPRCTGSRKGMNVRLARVKAIVRFSDDILSEKKSENFLQSCLSSSVERSCTVLNEWSSDFAIRQRSLESTAEDSWDRKYSCLDEFMSLFACRQALRYAMGKRLTSAVTVDDDDDKHI